MQSTPYNCKMICLHTYLHHLIAHSLLYTLVLSLPIQLKLNSAPRLFLMEQPLLLYITGNILCIYSRAVLATRDVGIIAIFPAGNDIDLKHRLTIIIFNIFFKF